MDSYKEGQVSNLTVVCHIHNEREFLPYFIMHYAPIAKKMVFLDDGSTHKYKSILVKSPVPYVVIRRESDQYDAVELDQICRSLERQVTNGWVITLCVDELLLDSPYRIKKMLREAEKAGYEFIDTFPYTMIQMPGEKYIKDKPLAQQFKHACRANDGRHRIVHRNQHEAPWGYSVGRHFEFQQHSMYPQSLLLGDFQFAPRELAFRRRTIDCARVKELDQGRGYGMPGKPQFSREVYESQYAQALSLASKKPWLKPVEEQGPPLILAI